MWVPNPRIFRAICFLSVIVVFAASAHAVVYTDAFVKGSYSFLINKWTADASLGQVGVLGVMHSDGAGNVTGSFSQVNRGVLQTATVTGTYVVNSNGTGSMTLTNPSGQAVQLAIVLNLDHGEGGHPCAVAPNQQR